MVREGGYLGKGREGNQGLMKKGGGYLGMVRGEGYLAIVRR